MIVLAILTFVSVSTSMVSAVTGMAGGIILLSMMTLVLPHHVLIPIHGVVQLVSNSSRTFTLFRSISWRLIVPFCLGLPIGVLFSYLLIKEIHNTQIFYLLISGLIFFVLFKPRKLKSIVLPTWCFFFVGAVSGVLSLLVGATGPFLAPFFLRDDLDKEELISTKSCAQTLTHLLKIPAFLSLGFPYDEHLILIGSMTVAAVLGTFLGIKVLHRINEELFLRIFKAVLFLIACRLIYLANPMGIF